MATNSPKIQQLQPPNASSASPTIQLPQSGQTPRPRVVLNMPPNNPYYSPAISPYLNTAGTHGYPSQYGGGPPQWPPSTPYASPFVAPTYQNKAGEFMFKQFEGFKDFTKSGLNMGEKSAFYIYNKFSNLSKRWFTHIFLLFIVFLYSVAGAFLFSAIEGWY